jgi:hypothetical protein
VRTCYWTEFTAPLLRQSASGTIENSGDELVDGCEVTGLAQRAPAARHRVPLGCLPVLDPERDLAAGRQLGPERQLAGTTPTSSVITPPGPAVMSLVKLSTAASAMVAPLFAGP